MIYRGLLHAHSTHSYDGKLSLTELKAEAMARGLSFICMTEHTDQMTPEGARAFVAECRSLSDQSFVFVPGFEVPYGYAHVLHFGATDFQTKGAENAAELTAWRRVTPLVVLAHPVRNAFVVDEPLRATIDGVEVWNQQYDGKAVPRTRSVALLEALRQEKPLLATGGVDIHRREHFGSPVTSIELPALSEVGILSALKRGQFSYGHEGYRVYATTTLRMSGWNRTVSFGSCAVIALGKLVNRTLARFGLRLPKTMTRAIRQRV